MKNIDYEIIDFIENKIKETRGNEQKQWVDRYDVFTSRTLFAENNSLEKLNEVNEIRILITQKIKEERQKVVDGALAIQMTAGKAPLEEDMLLFKRYIDVEVGIEEIQKLIIEKYKQV